MTAREDPALSADQSQRPPLGSPESPEGKEEPSGLPRLHFPRQPDGQGLAPAPGAAPPPGPVPWNGPPPPPVPGPGMPPGNPPEKARRWGNGRPPGRPAGPGRPLRPPEPAMRQRALAAIVLSVISLLALLGVGSNFHRGIYLVIFSLLVGLSACWFGLTAVRRARRSETMRPRGAIAGTVLGMIAAVLSTILLIAFAAFWPQLNSFSQCLSAANTPSAQEACLNQLHQSVPG